MNINNKGLVALTIEAERKELEAVGRPRLILQYLKRSKQLMGQPYWNVLSPDVKGYPPSGGTNGYPTFSLQTLKDRHLL